MERSESPSEKDSNFSVEASHSEKIENIHDMLQETLMVLPSSNSQLESGYTDAPPFSEHSNNYLNFQDHDPLTIGKLYLQFTNLDIRLKRVKDVIFPQDNQISNELLRIDTNSGNKRAAPQNRSASHHPPGSFLLSDHQPIPMKSDAIPTSPTPQTHINQSQLTEINPIWTGSSDVLSIGSFNGSFAGVRSSSSSSMSTQLLISTENIKVEKETN